MSLENRPCQCPPPASNRLRPAEVALRLLTPLPLTDFADETWDPHLLYRVPKVLGANADGFREDTDAATAAIAAVGDSLTFGHGVAAARSWPSQLETMSGRSVYNYGAPSYNVYQYYYLTRHAIDLGVEEVVVGFYPANDLRLHVCRVLELEYWQDVLAELELDPGGCSERQLDFEDFKKAEGVSVVYPLVNWAREHSAVLFLAWYAALKLKDVLPYDESKFVFVEGIPFAKARMKYRIYQSDLESELVQASDRNSRTLFMKMRDLAAARGVRFAVLIIPTKFQVARAALHREGVKIPERLETSGAAVQRRARWSSSHLRTPATTTTA